MTVYALKKGDTLVLNHEWSLEKMDKRQLKARVSELKRSYRMSEPNLKHDIWKPNHIRKINTSNFRGDNAYVWQKRSYDNLSYYITFKFTRAKDDLSILKKIVEHGEYGVETCFIWEDEILVSRDLLDSCNELNFLGMLNPTNPPKILDIGAGYGRFAKRAIESQFADSVTCVDAIPLSTALSEFYLRSEIAKGKGVVVPFNELQTQNIGNFDIAVNIHSFPEMNPSFIEFWVKFCNQVGVRYLFIVPNGKHLYTNHGFDFSGIFRNNGYVLVEKREKYEDADLNRYGLFPSTYYLFEKA